MLDLVKPTSNAMLKSVTCVLRCLAAAWLTPLTITLTTATGTALAAPAKLESIQRTHDCLIEAAQRHGHRVELVFGIAAQESAFNPSAVSYIKGKPIAYGVMQVYYDVHAPGLKQRGVEKADLFNPCVGADEGARILRGFMAVHGDSWKAVGAYYAGNRLRNESDRLWYSNAVAKRVAWFERHGVASVLHPQYRPNGKHSKTPHTNAGLTSTATIAGSALEGVAARVSAKLASERSATMVGLEYAQ